jgi:colanic acid/amylovoran biosynthesis glycosyltransferase
MRILYLLKHFPCLSQTFIQHEILELTRRGCVVYVASALRLKEELDSVDIPELDGRIIYLSHDYLYRHSPSGRYSDREVIDRAKLVFESRDDEADAGLTRRMFETVCRQEDDEVLRARGFLESMTVLSWIQREGVEHVHCDFAEENVKLAYLLHMAAGIPFSVKLRAYDIFAEPQREMPTWLNAAQQVMTISKYNKESVHRTFHVPRERITVIYDGIPVNRLRPSPNYRTSPFVIVSVGRLVEKKGHSYLIDACRILKSGGFRFECRIYGSGPMMEPLQAQIVKLGLSDSIHMLGARPHGEILESLESASVFVLPCIIAANGDRDATPNGLMEAMAKAIPVISTSISGIPEVIEDGVDGLLVEPQDADALARAILKVHANPSLTDRIRKNGLRKVERLFCISRNITEMLASIKFSGKTDATAISAYETSSATTMHQMGQL